MAVQVGRNTAANSCGNSSAALELRRSRKWLPKVTDFIEACPERYFATLTTKQRLTSTALSEAVSDCLHRVNTALFGTAYRRRREVYLATYAVQESNFEQGLHTHMLIGVPDCSLQIKANPYRGEVPKLILDTWCRLDHGGRLVGQDIKPVSDFAGACRYTNKNIFSLETFDNVDLQNTNFPQYTRLSL